MTGPATRLLDDRLQEAGAELARRERRLAEVEQQLEALDEMVAEAKWVASVLRDFDALWDVMTATNRYRLVHAIVEEVVVDGVTGETEIRLAELGDEVAGDEQAGTGLAAPGAPDVATDALDQVVEAAP